MFCYIAPSNLFYCFQTASDIFGGEDSDEDDEDVSSGKVKVDNEESESEDDKEEKSRDKVLYMYISRHISGVKIVVFLKNPIRNYQISW